MLSPSNLVAPLQLIATLVNEMNECNNICAHVHKRLVVINSTLLTMEKKKTLPPDAVVRDYSSLVTEFQVFLTKHKSRPWVYRVVMSRRVIGDVKDYQERIDTLMLALGVIHISAMADERANMERFRKEQEHVILAQLTDDSAVTKAVADVDQQLEAQSVLMHELRKADRLSAAATASATEDKLDMSDANQRLLTTALNKVIRRSKVHVRAVPEWFCASQDVDYEATAFAGGSFGTVHRGHMNNMDVVVKCLLVDTRGNANAMKQFRDEASLWFGFRHRHVLLMYSACDVSSPPFIVCELAANGNLFNFLRFDQNKPHTFRLLHQAALGLAFLHSKNVVHGDLKGDNILVSAEECAKIADFSFSYVRAMSASRYSMAQSTTTDGDRRRAGALRWRAPECFEGRSPTFASDVFSFGMCILEIASQAVPWGCRVDDITVRCLVMSGKLPERPSGMTNRTWNLVTRMCSLDPKDRPSLASVTSELSELANSADLAITTVSVKGEVSGRDGMATAFASVASFDPSTRVSTPKTLEQAIAQDDVPSATHLLSSSVSRFVDSWNAPPLIVAAATGATKVTQMLLAGGADASACMTATSPKLQDLDETGLTALHVAARSGHVSVVMALLTAKPHLIRLYTTKKRSALHFAAQFGHVAVIEELLRHGARVDEPAKFGETPLHWSAVHGQVESTRVLLAHKANLHAKDNNGSTALHVAAEKGHVVVIKELLQHGARVDEPGRWDEPPLYFSAMYGHVECARILLEHDANVHTKRRFLGGTPLHAAAERGHVEIAEALLAAGVEVTRDDVKVAKKNGHSELVRLLEPLAPPSRLSWFFG